jgi:hypothetical protein
MKRFSVIFFTLSLAMTATSCASTGKSVEEVCSQTIENFENYPSEFTESQMNGCIGDYYDYYNQ